MLAVFDVNETMLDLSALDAFFGGPQPRRQWFDLVIHTALTVTATGGYRSFGQIGADVLGEHDRRAEFGELFRALPAHPDVPAALTRLRDAGVDLVALANSPLPTVTAQLRNAGLEPYFDRVYSVEEAGALKPAAAPYRMVLRDRGVEPGDAVMVAAHGWDIAGAHAVGMRTAFLARPGQRQLPGGPAATFTAEGLTALAEHILGG